MWNGKHVVVEWCLHEERDALLPLVLYVHEVRA